MVFSHFSGNFCEQGMGMSTPPTTFHFPIDNYSPLDLILPKKDC